MYYVVQQLEHVIADGLRKTTNGNTHQLFPDRQTTTSET